MQPSALCSIFLADVGEVQESGEQLCFLDILSEVGPGARLNSCAANNYVNMCLIWQFLRQVRSSFSMQEECVKIPLAFLEHLLGLTIFSTMAYARVHLILCFLRATLLLVVAF